MTENFVPETTGICSDCNLDRDNAREGVWISLNDLTCDLCGSDITPEHRKLSVYIGDVEYSYSNSKRAHVFALVYPFFCNGCSSKVEFTKVSCEKGGFYNVTDEFLSIGVEVESEEKSSIEKLIDGIRELWNQH